MIAIYFLDRDTEAGSMLGRLLWNVMSDTVLKLHMPAETKPTGFVDDVAIVISAKVLEEE